MTRSDAVTLTARVPAPTVGRRRAEYFRFIGIEIRGIYDGPIIWECPLCRYHWPRFSPPGRLYDYAVLMIAMETTMKENG